MYQIIVDILKDLHNIEIRATEKISVDIQTIFKTMTVKYFYQNIPPVKKFYYYFKIILNSF
jgi:hypothetical protein